MYVDYGAELSKMIGHSLSIEKAVVGCKPRDVHACVCGVCGKEFMMYGKPHEHDGKVLCYKHAQEVINELHGDLQCQLAGCITPEQWLAEALDKTA